MIQFDLRIFLKWMGKKHQLEMVVYDLNPHKSALNISVLDLGKKANVLMVKFGSFLLLRGFLLLKVGWLKPSIYTPED